MAHFAKLNENNIVVTVVVVNNTILLDENNNEQESKGLEFLTAWSGGYTNWKQTSYNGTFRKNYAGIGYRYDQGLDAFIPPQPYPSWILNTQTCTYDPPVEYPTDGQQYIWSESQGNWILKQ